jgi:CDP-6-deoxy-D-xylo-4-hexulose-3-dehydrase
MIDDKILELAREAKPQYLQNYDNFEPGKDYVMYSGQLWDENELAAAMKSLLTGKWISAGEKVEQFQIKFSKKFNVKHSHMVNSGSSANLVMIAGVKKHLGWDDGDEVIVSPVGFPTTIAPLVQNNLKPVFVDIEFDTLNFDVNKIVEKITTRTRAIIVSPVMANPPDMDKLKDICLRNNLILIGDNCDSLGTKWKGNLITDLYYCWSTSFYPAHHMSTGEGGMISSNDSVLIDTVRSFSWWGRDCYCVGSNNQLPCGTCGNRFDRWLPGYDGIIDHKYIFATMGYNLKPLDLQGAIGLAQLDKVDYIDQKRREHKVRLENLLKKYLMVRVANSLPDADPSWFGVPIICETQKHKETLVAHFEANKIQTRNYFAGNILLHPAYKHLDNSIDYPLANKALSHVFILGCPPFWNEAVFEYIEKVIKDAAQKY